MKKRIAALALFALVPGFAALAFARPTTAEVDGEVFYHNNKPAANCTVNVAGKFDYVNGNGAFSIYDVPTGKHELSITCHRQVVMHETVTIRPPRMKLPKIVLH